MPGCCKNLDSEYKKGRILQSPTCKYRKVSEVSYNLYAKPTE
jgi:hypothetical protein